MKTLSKKELRQFQQIVTNIEFIKRRLFARISVTELSILLWSMFCSSKFFQKFKNFYICKGNYKVYKNRIGEYPNDKVYKEYPFNIIYCVLYCAQNNFIYDTTSDIPSNVDFCLVKTIN